MSNGVGEGNTMLPRLKKRSARLRRLMSAVLSSSCLCTYCDGETMATKFAAIADVPYNKQQAIRLTRQLTNEIPADSEFLIHLGDMRSAASSEKCTKRQFQNVATILKLSKIPVFAIMGDNDWNDCPNPDKAKEIWEKLFVGFESKYWPAKFTITRQPGYQHNFSFINKNTLFIGLNLVGGKVIDQIEWDTRLKDQATWTIELINSFYTTAKQSGDVGTSSVVIFGHADPTPKHDKFFVPVRDYINNVLVQRLPIMYMNGDAHVWNYEPRFYDQQSWLRLTLSGEAIESPTIFRINGTNTRTLPVNTSSVFLYDRQLVCEYCGIRAGYVVHKYFTNGKCVELCVQDKVYWEGRGYGCGNCTAKQVPLQPY